MGIHHTAMHNTTHLTIQHTYITLRCITPHTSPCIIHTSHCDALHHTPHHASYIHHTAMHYTPCIIHTSYIHHTAMHNTTHLTIHHTYITLRCITPHTSYIHRTHITLRCITPHTSPCTIHA